MSQTAAAVPKPLPPGAPTAAWLEENAAAQLTAYYVLVTPAMAEMWLRQNRLGDAVNRKFRKAHMRSIAMEMSKGQWRPTHQGIAFGTSGRLIDGQHRLAAIIESGTTQPFLVFVDCPEEGFTNFDRGAVRSTADVLRMDARLVSLAQTIVRACVRGGSGIGSGVGDSRRAMPDEVRRILEHYADAIAAMYEASAAQRVKATFAAVRAAWVVHYHGADAADKQLLFRQWKAFAEYDVKRMDESTAAGERRLVNLRNTTGGNREIEALCVGWLMFDPARRDLDRILIKDLAPPLSRFRAAVREDLPDLTALAGEKRSAANSRVLTEIMGWGVKERKHMKRERGWSPFADPVLGPEYRAKATAALKAKTEQRRAEKG